MFLTIYDFPRYGAKSAWVFFIETQTHIAATWVENDDGLFNFYRNLRRVESVEEGNRSSVQTDLEESWDECWTYHNRRLHGEILDTMLALRIWQNPHIQIWQITSPSPKSKIWRIWKCICDGSMFKKYNKITILVTVNIIIAKTWVAHFILR